jgi:hypothetical protein
MLRHRAHRMEHLRFFALIEHSVTPENIEKDTGL